MTPRVTLESLAAMIKGGFEQVDQQFSDLRLEIDVRFGRIEDRLEKVELRLDECAYRFEVAELSRRVSRLEQKFGSQ